MNKLKSLSKNKGLLIISCAIIVLAVILIIIGNSIASPKSTILRDRVEDGLSFRNATLEYKDGVSVFKVEVTNDNNDIYNLKYINIIFTDSKQVETKLIGYIGDSLKVSETKEIKASVDKDITDSISLEYEVSK